MSRNDWTCPVCTQPNTADASECINCLCPMDADSTDIEHRKQSYANQIGDFEYGKKTLTDGFRNDEPRLPTAEKKSLLGNVAFILVLIPLVIVAVGYLLTFLIPGCVMGGSNGAHSCGVLNPLVSFIGFWGTIYLVLGIGIFVLIVLPFWAMGVFWKDSRKK